MFHSTFFENWDYFKEHHFKYFHKSEFFRPYFSLAIISSFTLHCFEMFS